MAKALLWVGIKNYRQENQTLIDEVYQKVGTGIAFTLDINISNVSILSDNWWERLNSLSDEARQSIQEYRDRQKNKKNVFQLLEEKLTGPLVSTNPISQLDWMSLAEIVFWIGYLKLDNNSLKIIDEDLLDSCLNEMPLEILGDVFYGISLLSDSCLAGWLNKNADQIILDFRNKYEVTEVIEDEESITFQFFIDSELNGNNQPEGSSVRSTNENLIHLQTMERIELVRNLFPFKKQYGCKGFGHQLGEWKAPVDETDKHIPSENLPPKYATKINSIFLQLITYSYRPVDWKEYAEHILNSRKTNLEFQNLLINALTRYFKKRKPVNIFREFLSASKWDSYKEEVSNPPSLPKCAVDEWGFSGETSSNQASDDQGIEHHAKITNILALQKFDLYLHHKRKFFNCFRNFYEQATHTLILNGSLGKLDDAEAIEQALEAAKNQGINQDFCRLSVLSFAEVLENLNAFQKEFNNLFSKYIDSESLERFCKQESKNLEKNWSLWYQFVYHPEASDGNLFHLAYQKFNTYKSKIRRDIRNSLRNLKGHDVSTNLTTEYCPDKDQNALVVTYDLSNPVEIYHALDFTKEAVIDGLDEVQSDNLLQYALTITWPIIAIIPLVQGKSLDGFAWFWSTIQLISASGSIQDDGWWNLVPEPISSELLQKMDIELWENDQFDNAKTFRDGFAELLSIILHLADLTRANMPDEQAYKIYENHSEKMVDQLRSARDKFLGKASTMVDICNSMADELLEANPHLIEASSSIVEIFNDLNAVDFSDDANEENFQKLRKWSNTLQVAMEKAEIVRLCWISGVLSLR